VFFRKRERQNRLRPLSERECYLRLHGARSGEIEVVAARAPRSLEVQSLFGEEPTLLPPPEPAMPPRDPRPHPPGGRDPEAGSVLPTGPTDVTPALHLVFDYPRGAGTISGEQLRRGLLRRMQNRQGEAA
jgi:hypothetical protein